MKQISLFGEEISVEAKAKKFEVILQELQQNISKKDIRIKSLEKRIHDLEKENKELAEGTKEDEKNVASSSNNYLRMYYDEANKANYLSSELEKAISLFTEDYNLLDISMLFFYIKYKDIKFEFASKEAKGSFIKLYYKLSELYREEFEINEKQECELSQNYARQFFDETEIIKIEGWK